MWCRLGNKQKKRENIKSHYKTKICVIQKRSTFGRTKQSKKRMCKIQKALTN